MFPPFLSGVDEASVRQCRRRHQQRKLHTLQFWRDGLERQLAAINATITTLERQMQESGDT